MLDMLKFVLKGSLLSFITIVLVLMLIIWVPTLWGWSQYRVISASMYPSLGPGDIILVRPVEPSNIRVGDIVTYQRPGEAVVTHRVKQVSADGTFVTQGDSNPQPDSTPLEPQWLIGKVIIRIPLGELMR